MALSLFVVIDNHNNSQLVYQALIDNETAEAHIWILECTLLAIGGIKQSNGIISEGLIPLVFMIWTQTITLIASVVNNTLQEIWDQAREITS